VVRSESPAAFDGEAAGFEEWLEAVGLVALDFEGAVVELTAAAEGCFQFAQEVFQLGCVPCGGKSFEDENSFATTVGGGAAEEEALGGFFFRRGRISRRNTRSFAQRSEIEGREGVGPQFWRGVGGDALFLFPRHG
jgi:hypothetical protein